MLHVKLLENVMPIMRFGYIQRKWIEKHVEIIAKKYKMKSSDLNLMYFLRLNKEIETAKDIAKYTFLKRGNISLIVEALSCRGYINQIAIEGDRRMKRLVLTPKCDEILEELDEVINTLMKILLSGFSKEDLETLRKNFKCMYENMEKENSKSLEEKR